MLICPVHRFIRQYVYADAKRVVSERDIGVLYTLVSIYLFLPALTFIVISTSLGLLIYNLTFERRDSLRTSNANLRESPNANKRLSVVSVGRKSRAAARAARAAAVLTLIYVILNIPFIIAICYELAAKSLTKVGVTGLAEMVELYDTGLTGVEGIDYYLVAGVYVILPLVNSCVNPVVYFTQMKDFRLYAVSKMKSFVRILILNDNVYN